MTIRLFVLLVLLTGCQEAENPLIGKWTSDDSRTLTELAQKFGADSKYAICYRSKACGNLSWVYDENEYFVVFNNEDGSPYKKGESIKYNIVNIKGNVITYKSEMDSGEHVIVMNGDGYYAEEMGFREYFIKEK